MGVGVSAHRLAGTVAALRRAWARSPRSTCAGTIPTCWSERARATRPTVDAANLTALDREIRAARALAAGRRRRRGQRDARGVASTRAYVRQACASGADAIVMGAGLPLDLPDLAADFPDVALIPILSDARGIALVVKKWARKGRLPDAIVIEHPRYAGGHLGAAKRRGPRRPALRLRARAPGDARVLPRRGHRADGTIPLIPRRRHQLARARPRAARARRVGACSSARRSRSRRKATPTPTFKARAGRARRPRTSSSS